LEQAAETELIQSD